ncbi:MAG: cobalamin-dependent protein [Desulfotignum sp.]|jgi:methanogenic corrinoid protein MtbC1|nr:cobalamin-dependent protein [Desulfotignum sp.]
MTDNIVDAFTRALVDVDRLAAKQIVQNRGHDASPVKFAEDVVLPALERIGAGWQAGTFALSQVYMAGRICEDLIDQILPPEDPDRKNQPKMAICILSDHHKLGKIIVYSLLRASGFDLTDYGVMEVDDLVEQVQKDSIEILLISVLMLPSALKIKAVKQKLARLGCDVKLIVGGAPFRFDDRLWKTVGADAMCRDASDAVFVIENIMKGMA